MKQFYEKTEQTEDKLNIKEILIRNCFLFEDFQVIPLPDLGLYSVCITIERKFKRVIYIDFKGNITKTTKIFKLG